MTDWQRVAADFEEKYGVAQMWLDEAIALLEETIVYLGDRAAGRIQDFLERYEEERSKG